MEDKNTKIQVRHNKLPQWRKDMGRYFVTWRIHSGVDKLSHAERSLVANSIEHFHMKRYELFAYVVMNDHVHLVLETHPGFDLSDQLKSIKHFTALHINRIRGRRGSLWQKASYTRLLSSGSAVASCMKYVMENPTLRWRDSKEYKWMKRF